jgi:GNAT superfamily N-acetyltransferase
MLRLATPEDHNEVYRMLKAHWDHSPYKSLTFAEDKVRSKIDHFITNQGTDFIVILSCLDNGKPIGCLAAFAIAPEFSTERMATEMLWWVDKPYRQSKRAFELVKAYEYWADNKANCKIKHLALFEMDGKERIAKYYQRKGFVPMEHTYVKV